MLTFKAFASGSSGNQEGSGDEMSETWKEIQGWEGIYQISNHGKLRSFKRAPEGRVLSNINKNGGYFSVILCYKNKVRYTRLHRLVAETFIPNPETKPEVNHKDGNKQNTHAENLEWVSEAENVQDAIKRNPDIISGMKQYNQFVRPRTIQQFTLQGELLAEFQNSKIAEQSTGVCHRNILQVAGREEYKPGLTRKQAGGYVWTFKNAK